MGMLSVPFGTVSFDESPGLAANCAISHQGIRAAGSALASRPALASCKKIGCAPV